MKFIGIVLAGQLSSIDLITLQGTVIWEIAAVSEFSTDPLGLIAYPNINIDIYQDGEVNPFARYYPGGAGLIDQLFTSKVRITSQGVVDESKFTSVPSTVTYPLDKYMISSVFGARNPINNETIPILMTTLLGNIQVSFSSPPPPPFSAQKWVNTEVM